jgi:hypothetical protein
VASKLGADVSRSVAVAADDDFLMATKTLGLRNNNPGNIEYGPFARKYGGELGEGGRFARFQTMAIGFRVIAELLQAYYAIPRDNRIDTIQEVVERWAPSAENNVTAYVNHLCAVTGLQPNDRLDLADQSTLWWLALAIAEHECGHDAVTQYVTDADITAGINAALA